MNVIKLKSSKARRKSKSEKKRGSRLVVCVTTERTTTPTAVLPATDEMENELENVGAYIGGWWLSVVENCVPVGFKWLPQVGLKMENWPWTWWPSCHDCLAVEWRWFFGVWTRIVSDRSLS